jgi:twitching motility two-component system response regulator PilH
MGVTKVLVVDDSPVDLEHLKTIVTDAGYQVITASSGREAQEKAKSHRPDAILMDVVMEGVDGFEACRNITNDQLTAHIPVIFVTSKNQRADRVWGELQGGQRFDQQALHARRHSAGNTNGVTAVCPPFRPRPVRCRQHPILKIRVRANQKRTHPPFDDGSSVAAMDSK